MESPLASFGWLANCELALRTFMLANVRLLRVSAGAGITYAGDQLGGLFGLVEGQADFMVGIGNPGIGVGYFGYPGSWWGQGPLIGQPRLGSATAMTDCTVAVMPLTVMRQRLEENPADWEAMTHAMHDMFQMAAGAHADLQIPNYRRRLAATLLRPGGNRHRRFAVDAPIDFVCTQQALAGALGLARNSTGRLLRTLARDGLVSCCYSRITFLDVPGLEALANAE